MVAVVGSAVARSGDCCALPGDTGSFVGGSVVRSFVVPVESAIAVSSELFTSVLDSCELADDDEHVASPTDITSDLVISEVEFAIAVFVGILSSSSKILLVLVSELIRFDCCDLSTNANGIYQEKKINKMPTPFIENILLSQFKIVNIFYCAIQYSGICLKSTAETENKLKYENKKKAKKKQKQKQVDYLGLSVTASIECFR